MKVTRFWQIMLLEFPAQYLRTIVVRKAEIKKPKRAGTRVPREKKRWRRPRAADFSMGRSRLIVCDGAMSGGELLAYSKKSNLLSSSPRLLKWVIHRVLLPMLNATPEHPARKWLKREALTVRSRLE